MNWESNERLRAISQIEELVRERNRLLRERSALRGALRYLIAIIEKRFGAVVGPKTKEMARRGRR